MVHVPVFLLSFKANNFNYVNFPKFLWIIFAIIWVILTIRLVFPTAVDSMITMKISCVLIQSSSGEVRITLI